MRRNFYDTYKGFDIHLILRGPKDIEAFSIGSMRVVGYRAYRRTTGEVLEARRLNDLKKLIRAFWENEK